MRPYLFAFVFILPFCNSCERQSWEDTKSFHHIPKSGAAHGDKAHSTEGKAEGKGH